MAICILVVVILLLITVDFFRTTHPKKTCKGPCQVVLCHANDTELFSKRRCLEPNISYGVTDPSTFVDEDNPVAGGTK